MKNRLKKSSLKVLGFEFHEGRSLVANLKQNKARRYPFSGTVRFDIHTNQGTLRVSLAAGFEFDGRSGPSIIDWYTPNLGTLYERLCWLTHDANGYGMELSFTDTNVLLFAMLRDLANYRTSKANVVQLAVSLSKSWYGTPDKSDWCYKNIDKVITIWEPSKKAA